MPQELFAPPLEPVCLLPSQHRAPEILYASKNPVPYYQAVKLAIQELDCSAEKQELFSTVKLLRQTMLFDNGTGRASFDGVELSALQIPTVYHLGAILGPLVLHLPRQARVSSQGVSMPGQILARDKQQDSKLTRASHATG
ncbi:hypothetical protein HPP92_007653 [Vanilla planifolia]|uniref:Uncharacterized protein n=1 Tax=Vanilla planifolia TaxID=51239 RepID=A0A835RB09_VANPL|nr:hypothetical protein HPP92_007862 [Vanilla planifolia]KAG0490790.1 hypothetical protein HPP92_007653 [Vanilla planifolia]